MNLANLFAHAHSDNFRHVQETLDIPLSKGPPPSSSTYDLCMVVPLSRKEMSMEVTHVLERVITTLGRKYVYMYNAPDCSVRFVLLRGGSSRLRAKAEATGMTLLLDPVECLRLTLQGQAEHNIAPLKISHNPDITPLRPFDYIYARYMNRDPATEALYMKVTEGGTALFQKTDRMHLLIRMLNDSEPDGGAAVNTDHLVASGSLSAFFPLHSDLPTGENTFYDDLTGLAWPWHKPLDEVADYFGSAVAMYLSFLSHMCMWLILPAVVGAAFQAAAVATSSYSRPEIFVFAFAVSLWAVTVHTCWARQEARNAMKWNSDSVDGGGSADRDAMRADFRGIALQHSHIDGSQIVYYDPSNFYRGLVVTSTGFLAVNLCVLGVIAAIYVIRALLYATPVGAFNQFVSSGLNAVTIVALSYVFRSLGVALVDMENLRTEGEYEVLYQLR